LRDLVVPDLDLDAPILRAAGLGLVRRNGLLIAGPLVRDGLGGKRERALQQLGDLACAFARQTFVVAEHGRQRWRQRLRIGMAHEVQPHVAPVAHPVEDSAQLENGLVRNLRDTDFEPDRRHEVRELDGFRLLGRDFTHLEPIAGRRVHEIRVVDPLRERAVARQVALDGLAARRLAQ
jgi:hypothetical protein